VTQRSDSDEWTPGTTSSSIGWLWSKAAYRAIQGNSSGVASSCSSWSKTTQTLPVEAFIYLQGAKPITDFLGGQIELKPDGGVKVDEMMQTNIPGVWASEISATHPSRRWSRLGTVASPRWMTDT